MEEGDLVVSSYRLEGVIDTEYIQIVVRETQRHYLTPSCMQWGCQHLIAITMKQIHRSLHTQKGYGPRLISPPSSIA